MRSTPTHLSPPPPGPAFFDESQNAWILSRYADVMTALREPALRQAGPQTAPAQVREDVLRAVASSQLPAWQEQFGPLIRGIIANLPLNRPVDLIREALRPWSLAVTAVVLDLHPSAVRRWALIEPASAGGGGWLRLRRGAAKIYLKRLMRTVKVPGAQSLFLGLSQTLPEFVANAWLALLEYPDQLERLKAEPSLAPKAVEELLRFCGPVHSLTRQAQQTVAASGYTISLGQRVILQMASANRDPEQFPDPNTLNILRGGSGHLALGGGSHSCVGALLVRMASVQAIHAFAEELAAAELSHPVVWRKGATLSSPGTLRVWRRKLSCPEEAS